MKNIESQNGFTYMEVIVAIIIMTIGIGAMMSALSLSMLRSTESDKKNVARQVTSSALESIFAARDLRNNNALNNWDSLNNNGTLSGIFLTGWNPVRTDAGRDGINGTADDACATGQNCSVGGFTNSSPEVPAVLRQIVISNIPEAGIPDIRKKRVDISVRYTLGQKVRTETITTLITNLPFDNQ
jgi:type II secretory pathway pseudopilin PulG